MNRRKTAIVFQRSPSFEAGHGGLNSSRDGAQKPFRTFP